jgi:general stress protein YciG
VESAQQENIKLFTMADSFGGNMPDFYDHDQHMPDPSKLENNSKNENSSTPSGNKQDNSSPSTPISKSHDEGVHSEGVNQQESHEMTEPLTGLHPDHEEDQDEQNHNAEGRPVERAKAPGRTGARGTAAMDPQTRKEVARKGGLAVSRNKQHMAEIGRKGGQTVSKNREHMAQIGRKGGAASRGHR